MNKKEYLDILENELSFMNLEERKDVLVDINEFFDTHSAEGMSEEDICERLGTPGSVALEYRAQVDVTVALQNVNVKKSVRAARSSIAAGVVKAVILPVFYIGYSTIIILLICFGITITASLMLAGASIANWEPVVSTFAMPGIPASGAMFLSLVCAVTSLLGLLLMLWVKGKLLISFTRSLNKKFKNNRDNEANEVDKVNEVNEVNESNEASEVENGISEKQKTYKGLYKRVVQGLGILLAALLVAFGITVAFVPAKDYSFEYVKTASMSIEGVNRIEISAGKLPVNIKFGGQDISMILQGELKKTFAQNISLENKTLSSKILIDAKYTEGLSWGKNKAPILEITIPEKYFTEAEKLIVKTTEGKIDIVLPQQANPKISFHSKTGRLVTELPVNGNGINLDIFTENVDAIVTR